MRLMRHSVESDHYPWDLVYPSLGRGSFQQAGAEHVIQSVVAPLGNRIPLGVVGQGENLLNP